MCIPIGAFHEVYFGESADFAALKHVENSLGKRLACSFKPQVRLNPFSIGRFRDPYLVRILDNSYSQHFAFYGIPNRYSKTESDEKHLNDNRFDFEFKK